MYAGQRHSCHKDDGERCGFFVGDGTGVGKGREIASLVLDNWRHGRRRAVWCSISTVLLYDAQVRCIVHYVGALHSALHSALHRCIT